MYSTVLVPLNCPIARAPLPEGSTLSFCIRVATTAENNVNRCSEMQCNAAILTFQLLTCMSLNTGSAFTQLHCFNSKTSSVRVSHAARTAINSRQETSATSPDGQQHALLPITRTRTLTEFADCAQSCTCRHYGKSAESHEMIMQLQKLP
jgi:hypothetical protein